jgi:phosphonate transport system substrate-binding protein
MRSVIAAVLLTTLLVPTAAEAAPPPLRIGIGARISPRESFVYYEAMLNFVGRKLGRKVEMVQYTTYDEMDRALERLDLDFAFICAGPYVRDRAKFGAELLVAPQVHGVPFYYSYMLVPAGSPAKTLADLRGKRFAFTDPKSNTGRLVPTYMLAREFGLAPEKFFGSVKFTWSHDRSIDEVAAGTVDGASVDSLIYDYLAARTPARVKNVRILSRSIPFGIPPFVTTKAADPRLKKRLREVLLSMHEDPEGKRILDGMMVERFIVPLDANYDAVRDMEAWLDKQPRPKP